MSIKKIYQIAYYQFFKRHYFGLTASSRALPNFIIIGGVRCGTTSLYYNICKHPSVLPAAYDEIGFFDDNFHLGINWYRSMFPTRKKIKKIHQQTGKAITGEDTPFYIWNKDVIKRIKGFLPDVKLIVILRNPIDRAYSNYQMSVRDGNETKSFEEVVKNEIRLFNTKRDNKEEVNNLEYKKSYLAKGFYYEQLKHWFKMFNRKQIHVLFTENLRDNPDDTIRDIYKFLGLSEFFIEKYEKQKMFAYDDMDRNTRKKLSDFYAPHNEQLFELIESRCW